MNFGSLSFISWILMINSDSGSTCRPVFLSIALARRMYRDFSSLSNFFAAWISPVFSSITNILPAPSPVNMYFKFPSPLSWSVWSFREVEKKEFYKYMHCDYRKIMLAQINLSPHNSTETMIAMVILIFTVGKLSILVLPFSKILNNCISPP